MALDESKGWFSLFGGVILIAMGLIPLLNQFGIIGFNFPAFMLGFMGTFITYLIAAAGVWLVVDGFFEWGESMALPTLALGLLAIGIGIIPILNQFGIIEFSLGFMNLVFYQIVFIIEGILLVIAAVIMP